MKSPYMPRSPRSLNRFPGKRSQQGVVLFIALIALVAMTLAGIALVRSVDTGNIIAGNVAFKQAALQEADRGVEAGYDALNGTTPIANRDVDDPALNYYASIQQEDPNRAGVPSLLSVASPAIPPGISITNSATGNTIYYVIERLCSAAGAASSANCVLSGGGKAAGGGTTAGSRRSWTASRL